MPEPDPHDNTSADYEQFEKYCSAQDRNVAGVDTADVDNATAQSLASELIDANIVAPGREDRVLIHEPSGTAFDSATQLAIFHGS